MDAIEQRTQGENEKAAAVAEIASFEQLNAKFGAKLDSMPAEEWQRRMSGFGYALQRAFAYRPTSPVVRFELLKLLAREAAAEARGGLVANRPDAAE